MCKMGGRTPAWLRRQREALWLAALDTSERTSSRQPVRMTPLSAAPPPHGALAGLDDFRAATLRSLILLVDALVARCFFFGSLAGPDRCSL